jgi:hypothetical protein
MTSTPGVNPAIQEADAILQGLLYNVAVTAAVAALDTQFPWMTLPLVDNLVHEIVHIAAEQIYKELSKFVAFTIIDSQIAGEKGDYGKAENEFKTAHASGDQAAIDKAIADLKAAADRLIHSDGS